MRIIWLVLAWPLVEIGLFVTVGGWLGLWGTWGVVLGTALAGVLVIRWQKASANIRVVQDLQRLSDTLLPAAHSALIVLAGVLLILPGFLTDALGVCLLLPPVRNAVIARIRAKTAQMEFAMRGQDFDAGRPAGQDSMIIDLEAEEIQTGTAPQNLPHKPSGWTKP